MDRLKCMRVFVRVAHTASFAATARELRVSAATVTKQVSALESELGVRLLERTTRKVQLTEAGRFYLERCGEALQAIDDTDAAMSQMSRAPSGLLRLTAPVDMAPDMAQVIAAYSHACPNVTVDLRLANHNIDLIDQGFDLGIGLMSASHASYISRKLCTARLGAYAAPAYLREHGYPRKPADLTRHRHLIFNEPQPRIEWSFRKGHRTMQIQIEPATQSNSGNALLQLAIRGAGIVIGPSLMIHEAVAAGLIERILPDYDMGALVFHARYPSRRFLPAKVRSFLEALRAHFGDDPDQDIWWSRVDRKPRAR